ncbi:Peptidase family M23 [Tistlia consotensis]|uniref:Peptidase family M23 n=1 Tax=Tistlia consotensis USBA 355 TaxID=560819 RepID=A0A1Y6BVD3_9PROT|nr:M23 family metallopeptidase [Tistlia consotensis]SMF22123.1 Peptidase family M23 [Tistlia consotensis USBA 355]SNR46269.1 Peptidase family M23 [Tistlia consotensis]
MLCEIGVECFVQQYVDTRPGPLAQDYLCGGLAYDRHDGTDIRVPTLADMERGVPVVAAAPGTVRAVRDGEPDMDPARRGLDRIKGRESGNAVLIDHLGGWTTQYSHLKQGSVLVRPGQRVGAGQILGLIGQSGLAEFPHVEFRLFHGDQRIDPFTGLPPESGCDKPGRALWDAEAAQALVYRAGGLLAAGFAGSNPEIGAIKAGAYLGNDRLPASAAALAFWVIDYGLEPGDSWRLEIHGPDGRLFAESDGKLDRKQADWIRVLGRRRGDRPWPSGRYEARHRVARNGVVLIDRARAVVVE